MMILGMLKLLQFPMTAFSAAFSFAAIKVAIWVWSIQDDRLGQIYRIAIRQNFAFGGVLERLKSGLPFSGLALGTAMLQTSLPLAIVAACGYSVAAQFSIALSFANLAGVPLGILNLCVLPRCTTLVRNSQLDEAGCLVSSTAGIALLSSSAIGISTCVLSPVAIQMLGASYSDISLILWLLVIASVLDSIPGPSVALLQAMHLEGVWSRLS